MPASQELNNGIKIRESSRPVLKAVELVAIHDRVIVEEQLRLEQPHFKEITTMFEEVRERDPLLLSDHPLAAARPDNLPAHVLLVSMTKSLFCQPPIHAQTEYIRTHYAPDATKFTPFGDESNKIIQKINGKTSVEAPLAVDLNRLRDSASTLSTIAVNSFLQHDVTSVRLVHIQKNLAPQDTILLPIPIVARKTDAPPAGITIEGDQNAVISQLFQAYLSAVIYNALLETQVAEHVSRMLTAHGAVENIDDVLPQLRLLLNGTRRQGITNQILELSQND